MTRGMLILTPFPNADGCETFGRPFDLSKFPNLQEVSFGIGWFGGGIPWIPPALSSIRPATSPHLSAIQLSFDHPLPANRYIDAAMIKVMDSDLRWVADEVARIEREFEGAVNLVVLRDAGFKVVLDKLNVRFHFGWVDHVDSFPFVPCRSFSFSVEIVEVGYADTTLVCSTSTASGNLYGGASCTYFCFIYSHSTQKRPTRS